jgi:N-acetylglucosamine-6-phosphate deacetylase
MLRLRARDYRTGKLIDVLCDKGVIQDITPPALMPADFESGWIAPPLFDLQINGCDGISFNSERLRPEDVRHVVDVCRQHGIAGLCPTLVTNSFEALRHGFTTLRQARGEDPAVSDAVPGFHLEGPYISTEDGPRGAHPRQHVRPPDRDEFSHLQEAAGGRIILVTLAPEHEGALHFIEWMVSHGVAVALGHTGASPSRIREAIQAGARLSTHLGNGCHSVLPRHDNYLWEQLAADELWASLICDGHHLPVSVMRCLLRAKTPERVILTCDASSLAGLPPGRYAQWDSEFEVLPGGKVVVPGTPYLAGSGVFLDACLSHVLRHTDLNLCQAVDMAGARPRELLGLSTVNLEAGSPADLILFDHEPGGDFIVRSICPR